MWIVEPSLQNDHPFLYSLLNWPYSETFARLFPAVLLFSLVFLLSDWIVLTRNSENALSFEDPLQIPSGPIPKPKKRGREWCEAVLQLLSAVCILLSEAPVPYLKEVELHFLSNLWRNFDPELHITRKHELPRISTFCIRKQGRDSIALKNITKKITKIIMKKLHIKKLQ